MAYKKVEPAMIEQWHTEISRRIYQERKTNIIENIAKREGLTYNTVYYWTQSEHYRLKRRQYAKSYCQKHLEEYRANARKYAREHRQKQLDYERTRRSNPQIRAHNCAQTRLRWKVNNHTDEVLAEIVSAGNEPVTISEMVGTLQDITSGITVRASTLEKSIENYLAHNSTPIIKKVITGKYIRI